MSFLHPLALLALPVAVLPLLLAWLRERSRRSVRLPSLWLLRRLGRERPRASRRRRLLEALLESLLLASLILAAAHPVRGKPAAGVRHWIFFFDGSPTVEAARAKGPLAASWAESVRRFLEADGGRSTVSFLGWRDVLEDRLPETLRPGESPDRFFARGELPSGDLGFAAFGAWARCHAGLLFGEESRLVVMSDFRAGLAPAAPLDLPFVLAMPPPADARFTALSVSLPPLLSRFAGEGLDFEVRALHEGPAESLTLQIHDQGGRLRWAEKLDFDGPGEARRGVRFDDGGEGWWVHHASLRSGEDLVASRFVAHRSLAPLRFRIEGSGAASAALREQLALDFRSGHLIEDASSGNRLALDASAASAAAGGWGVLVLGAEAGEGIASDACARFGFTGLVARGRGGSAVEVVSSRVAPDFAGLRSFLLASPRLVPARRILRTGPDTSAALRYDSGEPLVLARNGGVLLNASYLGGLASEPAGLALLLESLAWAGGARIAEAASPGPAPSTGEPVELRSSAVQGGPDRRIGAWIREGRLRVQQEEEALFFRPRLRPEAFFRNVSVADPEQLPGLGRVAWSLTLREMLLILALGFLTALGILHLSRGGMRSAPGEVTIPP